ncbi:MAG TPA: hypothetical protein VIG46_11015, partial [Candidatus Baltobacteraceae bacterium]
MQPAWAIPIFAQRYHLQCSACHSVLPELNAFGLKFRSQGYRLPLPKHGTTLAAIRYQMEYERDPVAGSQRFSPGGIVLANADVGAFSAFLHYSLGAGGGPGGVFLGYVDTYNAHTRSLYRAGLFELPLAQSPGQRLDDLAPYGYYGAHVGLNDLPLSSPRWGIQAERTVGATRFDLTASLGEYKGAAYGGKPIPTGVISSAAAPEIGFFADAPIGNGIDIGAEDIAGTRRIVPTGRPAFEDGYNRLGLLGHARVKRFDFQAEQWWGRDADVDGFGTFQSSSGGYARLKFYPTPHVYLGIRYDAVENPFLTRDVVYYGAFHVTPHARLLIQQVQPIGGKGELGAALTVGFPWPANL